MMEPPHTPRFEANFTQPTSTEGDAEAALEALRAAIQQPQPADNLAAASSAPRTEDDDAQATLEKALGALSQLSSTSQTIFDHMNLPGVIQGLTGSFKLLVESNRRQTDIVKGLVAQLSGQRE